MRRKSKGDREEARRRERSLRQRQDDWHVERLEVKQVGETYSAWEDLQATPDTMEEKGLSLVAVGNA
ncbi:hypothetical protein [uncultured Selenomonas sp.]|uniref:hypothetical protein n=1 Tax=uncultured Selenomonas sp. TaxID=159275 RepID=UPI0028DC550D|nr:hypothetical protein [uncultured Selenomonas sp.]